MSDAGRPLRVVIFDRGLMNPYSQGLAAGLETCGVSVAIAGPVGRFLRPVVPVYPRGGVPGRRIVKTVDAALGLVHLMTLLARFRPDVVHFQWPSGHDYALARLARLVTNARMVFTVHNPVPRDAVDRYRWQEPMIRLADALIVHGPRLRDDLLRGYEIAPERVHVVPHGNFEHAVVRHDRAEARSRLGLPEDEPVFAFVGQLLVRKGVDTLIEAFRLHCERGLPGTLVVVGTTTDVDEGVLRQGLRAFPDRVRWLTDVRALPPDAFDLVLSAATLVALPFRDASQSGSVLYAMTHGRCVVTTAVGELPDTVAGHGHVVPAGDAEALAVVLADAAADPDRCDEIGRSARAYVLETLDWSGLARLTLEAYRDAPHLGGHGAREGHGLV